MDKQTLKALKGSIGKWEKIVAGTGADKRSNNCPLCKHFDYSCSDCLVGLKTGDEGCFGSPWEKWIDHQGEKHCDKDISKVYCPTCLRLAKAELAFLKSLLPKTKKP